MELGGEFVLCIYVAASYVEKETEWSTKQRKKSHKTVKIKSPTTERWGILKSLPKLKIFFFLSN